MLVRRIVRRVIVTHPAPQRDAAPAAPAAPQGTGAAPASAPAAAGGRSRAGSRSGARPDHPVLLMHDVTFTCMGCDMRLLAEGVDAAGIVAARDLLHAVDARLSRFRAGSELVRLNADPRATVPASALLRAAVAAAVWAAERTDGLVDPTLLDALERQGYTRSLAGAPPAGLAGVVAAAPRRAASRCAPPAAARDLGGAVAAAPPRAPAAARSDRRWRAVAVDNAAGTITRPPGLRLDTGGTTKGLAADAAAQLLLGRPAAARRAASSSTAAATCASRSRRARRRSTSSSSTRSPASPPRRCRSAAAGSRRPGWRGACGARPTARPSITCSTRRPESPPGRG